METCYRKGVEEFLRENGLKYFIVESHLLQDGDTKGVYADRFGAMQRFWKQSIAEDTQADVSKTPYTPYLLDSANADDDAICVFVRDHVTGRQVWSKQGGYPGDEWYLEFHKKHFPGGLRYWRVTGPDADLGDKIIYQPAAAAGRVKAHAEHFVDTVHSLLTNHLNTTQKPGVICAPYDTELYGHWWFEGVDWLYHTLKMMHDNPDINVVTGSEALESHMPTASISLPEGSWGEGGSHTMWLNESTDWTWSYVYQAELEMKELATKYADDEKILPVLKQAAREVLLLESSDWQFSISTKTSKDYGEFRLTEHYKSFQRLAQIIRTMAQGEEVTPEDWNFYKISEEQDCLFKDIDPSLFAALESPSSTS